LRRIEPGEPVIRTRVFVLPHLPHGLCRVRYFILFRWRCPRDQARCPAGHFHNL